LLAVFTQPKLPGAARAKTSGRQTDVRHATVICDFGRAQ
jgi:hypothetical protein